MPEQEIISPLPTALQKEYRMALDEMQVVNIDGEILESQRKTRREFGIAVPLIARIKAGKHLFSVLDMREDDSYSSPLLVVDSTLKTSDNGGYKGIWQDVPVMLGRQHHENRFNYDSTVSRDHFSLAYTGLGLIVANQSPLNGTLLSGDLVAASQQKDDIVAEFTEQAEDKMQDRYDFGRKDETAPYGYYKNHRIIGRNTAGVKDGVYFTTNSEAVVVDDKSRGMQDIAHEFQRKFEKKFGREPTVYIKEVLKLANKYTREVMPYDLAGTERLSEPHYDNNGLIGLSEYVSQRVGVCRHQCLVAAYLLETLVDKGQLVGVPRVERNHDLEANGAHAWAIFQTPGGQAYVIDPAQNFVGTKEEARAEGRWKYNLAAER